MTHKFSCIWPEENCACHKHWLLKRVSFNILGQTVTGKVLGIASDKDGYYLEIKLDKPNKDAIFDPWNCMVYVNDPSLKEVI